MKRLALACIVVLPLCLPIAAQETSFNEELTLPVQDLVAYPVEDYGSPLSIPYGPVPTGDTFTDGEGLGVFLEPGQGTILLSDLPINVGGGPVELTVSLRSTGDAVRMAVVAIASPVDGSLGYVNPMNSEVPVDDWRKFRLVYDPPTTHIIPGLQFVVPEGTPEWPTIVYVDEFKITPYVAGTPSQVELEADGTFNEATSLMLGLLGLNPNVVLPEGATPGTVTVADGMEETGLRLLIAPEQLLSNIALFSIAPTMPTMVHGRVYVKRESLTDDGFMMFVITDADQSAGHFIQMAHLPLGEFTPITIGGNFHVSGKQLAPLGVVQLAGPDADASVIVDDYEMYTQENVWPGSPPGPVGSFDGQTLNLPGLPEGAKPLEMVLIPAGETISGEQIAQSFYIGKYEVTQEQWAAVMGHDPSNSSGPNKPVEMVSWYDCQEFIQRLNELGQGAFRLPTEREWEYACRAGTTTRYYWGDSEDADYLWNYYTSNVETHPVGEKLPNAWQLYDMSGNVMEWCQDEYGQGRANRGGSATSAHNEYCWSGERNSAPPDQRSHEIGLRLVREYP